MLRKSSPVSFWNVCTELFSSITMTHFLTYNSVFIKYQVRAKARKCILCILCVLCISDRGTNFSIQAPQIGYWPKIGYPTRTTSLWLIQTTGGGGGGISQTIEFWLKPEIGNQLNQLEPSSSRKQVRRFSCVLNHCYFTWHEITHVFLNENRRDTFWNRRDTFHI